MQSMKVVIALLAVLLCAAVAKKLILSETEKAQTDEKLPISPRLLQLFNSSLVLHYSHKLYKMNLVANVTVIVHEHIPKAGGTALGAALSYHCACHGQEVGCSRCDKVTGLDGTRFKYVVARSTGWICGVHSPLTVMRHVPCDNRLKPFAENGISTAFVVMVRDPWDRFVSEISKWCRARGQSVDWSIRNKRHDKWVFYKDAKISNNSEIYDASLYPADIILHNRNIKMIGGRREHFNMHFNGNVQIGSRWIGGNNLSSILQRAIHVMHMDANLFPLIHERFEESLCIIESVFGNLYRFRWNPNKHSHNHDVKYKAPAPTVVPLDYFDKILVSDDLDLRPHFYPESNYLQSIKSKIIESYINNVKSRNVTTEQGAFRNWLDRNAEDVIFYAYTKKIFEANFIGALLLVSRLISNDNTQIDNFPHCTPYLKIANII